ncbi:MAG: anion permease [Tissierellales bacterium]|nr:anion permease [Tissierellales bacterium]MBN2828456.1 anion permease [Tissierellales bacterium]
MIHYLRNKIEKEIVFVIATCLTVLSAFFTKTDIGAINWAVLCALWNLMLISLSFETYHLLDAIAVMILRKANSIRTIGVVMILLTALMGMLMTNDVALLTIVPITLVIGIKAGFNPCKMIVLETVSANIGSSLTPFGNPQNLFLYQYFQMNLRDFFSIQFPLTTIGILLILLINHRSDKHKIHLDLFKVRLCHPMRLSLYGVLFVAVILSVVGILDYRWVTLLVAGVVLILDRYLFFKVDYFLLMTFVAFFILIDNLTQIYWISSFVKGFLDRPIKTYLAGIFLSQGISNVPAAILLSGFSAHRKAILLGVSVGGLGTLIASMANLISYKLYIRAYGKSEYMRYFHLINFALLMVVGILMGLRIGE